VNAKADDRIGGVVFDCDGVLADTTGCWNSAFRRTAARFGLPLTHSGLRHLQGSSIATAAERIAQWAPGEPSADSVAGELLGELDSSIDSSDLRPIAGACDLLQSLHGVARLGVASNSPGPVLLRILARLGISHFFAAAISADDVLRPKPAPDPYLAACDALGVDPPLSFAVEDSGIGAQSAVAAGLRLIELSESRLLATQQVPASALRVESLADPRVAEVLLASLPSPSRPAGTARLR
jgi:HAD superfamily hydrolase (TIGR01509 family)